MDKEALKTTCRSMITASHYNNLDDAEFDNYIESIIAKVLPEGEPPLCQDCKSPIRLNQNELGLNAFCKCASVPIDNPSKRWSSPKG